MKRLFTSKGFSEYRVTASTGLPSLGERVKYPLIGHDKEVLGLRGFFLDKSGY